MADELSDGQILFLTLGFVTIVVLGCAAVMAAGMSYERYLTHVETMAKLKATQHEHALLFAPGEPRRIALDAVLPIG